MAVHRNLLVVLASGLRSDVFSYVARWPVHTPHFDDLATWGISLAATTVSPATTPAMLSLYTGLHPRQHGVLDEGTPRPQHSSDHARHTWASQLAEAGYHVVGIGRVGPIASACHEYCPVGDVSVLDDPHCSYLAYAERRGLRERVQQQRRRRMEAGPFGLDATEAALPLPDDIDSFITQQAMLAIETLPTDKPFALIVGFTGPGNDLPTPQPYRDRVDAAVLRRAFAPAALDEVDAYAEIPYPRTLVQQLDGDGIATIRQHYLGRVAMLDQAIGQIRSVLDRYDLGPQTWISLCSDRGQLLGERGLVGHRSLLGPAVNVPLWVQPPERMDAPVREPHEVEPAHRLVSNVDLAATLCAIGGVDPPRGCVGESILPAMHLNEVGRDQLVCEFGTRLMLETMQHRIIYDVESLEPRALFDLLHDPEERHNLLGTPTALGIQDMLHWQLASALLPMRPCRW